MTAVFSLVTAIKPGRISKGFTISDKNALIKIPGGQLVEGEVVRSSADVRTMGDLLSILKPSQALVYGVTEHPKARIVTNAELEKITENGKLPLCARTRKHFHWPEGPGVLMLDYDPPDGAPPLSTDELRHAVYGICPDIKAAPHIVAASASSYIYNGDNLLRGASGWRMLVIVADGRDIPRAGAVFFSRCWLKGQGYIAVSKAGSLLERALVDSNVWQPERLDFVGGAHCFPPLQQKRPAPALFNPDGEPLDTRVSLKNLTLPEQVEKKKIVDDAKQSAEPAALKKRDAWIQERISDALADIPEDERPQKERDLRETYMQAVKTQVLLADFVLQPEAGGTVTVADLLDNPAKWHGKRFADPLEPEYQLDSRIAVANLFAAGRPYVFSHAHGGRRFTLHRARQTLLVIKGERVRVVDAALELMRLHGQHYIRGGEIVKLGQTGELFPRDAQGVCFDLDGIARFEKIDDKGNTKPADCPPHIATGVCVNQTGWKLPILDAVATAPLLDPQTGRVIDKDGYDPETRTMLILNDLNEWRGIPENPTLIDIDKAADTLWFPFEKFPFVGPIDRGVMLAAILTAIIRPLLKTSPAFAYDAPTAASGKTLLARCLSELAGDSPPTVFPIAEKEDEIRKRLLAVLRSNRRVIVVDNAIDEVESAALCAFLTNEVYGDRLLGESTDLRFPTRALFIFTGNNLAIRGDLCRRVLTARIDPEMEQPWTRQFDFDPAEYCRENRLELVAAGLTILRAGMQKGPEMPDRTASFEMWSDSVRRAVLYLKERNVMDAEDPIKSITTALSADSTTQNLKTLLAAWFEEWNSAPATVSQLMKTAIKKASPAIKVEGKPDPPPPDDTLLGALRDIAPGKEGGVNNRSLGKWLEQNRDRIMDNLRLCSSGRGHGGGRAWRVKSTNAEKNKAGQEDLFKG